MQTTGNLPDRLGHAGMLIAGAVVIWWLTGRYGDPGLTLQQPAGELESAGRGRLNYLLRTEAGEVPLALLKLRNFVLAEAIFLISNSSYK